MQKPLNKPLKDFLLEKTSQDLQVSQETVDKVIGWSYKKANLATHSNKEVEISGFGKLLLSQSKLRKHIEKLEHIIPLTSGEKRESIEAELKLIKEKWT